MQRSYEDTGSFGTDSPHELQQISPLKYASVTHFGLRGDTLNHRPYFNYLLPCMTTGPRFLCIRRFNFVINLADALHYVWYK
jgi:hypothetical protein